MEIASYLTIWLSKYNESYYLTLLNLLIFEYNIIGMEITGVLEPPKRSK